MDGVLEEYGHYKPLFWLNSNELGCVIYYGMPEKDVNQLKKLQAEVLGIFATQDGRINGEVVKEFENNMKTANKKLTVKTYDTVHGIRL